ncbi:hypothetical protein MLD38_000883 [Melastoma candidum]|uniref:Uncharacterized protein n=1 Tax=Melastoma candidum TaxID=119954 RepID=A0ACB9SET4_9MYRT|nr:hypothetical protein MLD38_000883 [Melastoma candidum]
MNYYSVPNLVVDTTSRLAQWRINDLSCTYTCLKSEPFKLGPWNWHLFVEKNRVLYVKLYPESFRLPEAIGRQFLDLKAASKWGAEPCSIWAEGLAQKTSNESSLSTLARMLKEGIHTDIIVNASDGSIGAHRAVLASRSPVFRSMFSYDLKEEEPPAIDIPDMSIAACEAS